MANSLQKNKISVAQELGLNILQQETRSLLPAHQGRWSRDSRRVVGHLVWRSARPASGQKAASSSFLTWRLPCLWRPEHASVRTRQQPASRSSKGEMRVGKEDEGTCVLGAGLMRPPGRVCALRPSAESSPPGRCEAWLAAPHSHPAASYKKQTKFEPRSPTSCC